MTVGIVCGIFWVLSVVLFFLADYYVYHSLKNPKNKIEWKCEETENSFEKRIGEHEKRIDFEICYRIKPSEMNWFVRLFGNYEWHYPFRKTFFSYEEFIERDFKTMTKDYETLGDIKKLETKEGKIKLYR